MKLKNNSQLSSYANFHFDVGQTTWVVWANRQFVTV